MSQKHLDPYAFNPIVADSSTIKNLSLSAAKKKLEKFVKQDSALHSAPNDVVHQLGQMFESVSQRVAVEKKLCSKNGEQQ